MTPHGKVATERGRRRGDWPLPTSPPDRRPRGAGSRTIGGSIANNDPRRYPAAALALGATIITKQAPHAADEFFHRSVRHGAGGRRDRHKGLVSAPLRRVTSNSEPRLRYALVGVFIARGRRRACRGDWRGSEGVFRHSGRRRPCPSVSRPKRSTASPFRPRASMVTSQPAPSNRAHLINVLTRRAVRRRAELVWRGSNPAEPISRFGAQ